MKAPSGRDACLAVEFRLLNAVLIGALSKCWSGRAALAGSGLRIAQDNSCDASSLLARTHEQDYAT